MTLRIILPLRDAFAGKRELIIACLKALIDCKSKLMQFTGLIYHRFITSEAVVFVVYRNSEQWGFCSYGLWQHYSAIDTALQLGNNSADLITRTIDCSIFKIDGTIESGILHQYDFLYLFPFSFTETYTLLQDKFDTSHDMVMGQRDRTSVS